MLMSGTIPDLLASWEPDRLQVGEVETSGFSRIRRSPTRIGVPPVLAELQEVAAGRYVAGLVP